MIYVGDIEPDIYIGQENNIEIYNDDEMLYPSGQHDYSMDYLTFVALEDGTFKLSGNTVNYSLDGGETWTSLASNTNTPTIHQGEKILFKAQLTPDFSNGVGTFVSTKKFNVEGNPMSLLYGDNFIGQNDLSDKNGAFSKLFRKNANVVDASNMKLPATTLANSCYGGMFSGCTSLTTSPELPATTLATGCYGNMFLGCTSLTAAPNLSATTLANECYHSMFYQCTSLTKAPELPATTLLRYCYYQMFYGCSSLNYIKMLAIDISASNCLTNWVNGVSATGTFVKSASQTSLPTGVNGIPDGWQVENI